MWASLFRGTSVVLISLSVLTGCGGGGTMTSSPQIAQTPPPVTTPPTPPTLAHYTVTDLPPLRGASASQAQGLNAAGDVVGYSVLNAHAEAVIWKSGIPTDLGIPNSWANAVNSSDQIAGYYTSGSGTPHAALWVTQGFLDLGTLPGMDSSVATGIDDSGNVVGVSFSSQNSADQQGFIWTSATGMQPIPGSLCALAVNNGHVAGMDTGNHAATFFGGQTSDLGTIGSFSEATALNFKQDAAGASGTHAFVFNGSMQDLGLRDNWTSAAATGINDAGVVVGYGLSPAGAVRLSKPATLGAWSVARDASTGNSHPFTWTSTFGLNDINTLIPTNSGWTIVVAAGINSSGQICGLGQNGAALHAVLLNPN